MFLENYGCLPFDRKIRLGCRKLNGKRFTSLPQNCLICYGLNPKRGEYTCVARVWNRPSTRTSFSSDSKQITITTVIRVDSGKYVCEATNDVTTVQSSSATHIVQCKITIFYGSFKVLDRIRLNEI